MVATSNNCSVHCAMRIKTAEKCERTVLTVKFHRSNSRPILEMALRVSFERSRDYAVPINTKKYVTRITVFHQNYLQQNMLHLWLDNRFATTELRWQIPLSVVLSSVIRMKTGKACNMTAKRLHKMPPRLLKVSQIDRKWNRAYW